MEHCLRNKQPLKDGEGQRRLKQGYVEVTEVGLKHLKYTHIQEYNESLKIKISHGPNTCSHSKNWKNDKIRI